MDNTPEDDEQNKSESENYILPWVLIKDNEGNICFEGHLMYSTPPENPTGETPQHIIQGIKGESYVIPFVNSNYVIENPGEDIDSSFMCFLKLQLQSKCYGRPAIQVFNVGLIAGLIVSTGFLFSLYQMLLIL